MQLREAQLEDLSYSTRKMNLSAPKFFQKKRTEEDMLARTTHCSDTYKHLLLSTNRLRQDYFVQHLPSLLKVRFGIGKEF
jgi:hypothetical protein